MEAVYNDGVTSMITEVPATDFDGLNMTILEINRVNFT